MENSFDRVYKEAIAAEETMATTYNFKIGNIIERRDVENASPHIETII